MSALLKLFKDRPRYSFRSFFDHFFRLEASSGILLMAAAAIALIWANSPWRHLYFSLWEAHFITGFTVLNLNLSLLHWINDGLMTIFFFVVGLEIKREVLTGELSSWRRASLPIVAAIGGMLIPALLYIALNYGRAGSAGWAIPMATDIAFTLGVLALLGRRIPLALKIFITALAIVDDIGAMLVIALAYTADVALPALIVAIGVLAGLLGLNRAGVRQVIPYLVLGIMLWIAVLLSGVHATLAGVLLALTIPIRVRIDTQEFLVELHDAMNVFEATGATGQNVPLTGDRRAAAAQALELASERVTSPLHRLEHDLHPWVSYGILPLFALANAGVTFVGETDGGSLINPLTIGVMVGLVIGKPLGISLLAWIAVRLGVAELPEDVSWRHILGVSMLAGIGFTMSIFVASLAFTDEPDLLSSAKLGILVASLIAGIAGWLFLRTATSAAQKKEYSQQ